MSRSTKMKPSEHMLFGLAASEGKCVGGLSQGERVCAVGAMFKSMYGEARPHMYMRNDDAERRVGTLIHKAYGCSIAALNDGDLPEAKGYRDHNGLPGLCIEDIAGMLDAIRL